MWTENFQKIQFENPVQVGFRKGRGTRDQIANIHWIREKAREFQENIYFFFDYVDQNKLWRIPESWNMGISDHLTRLLRNLTQVKKQQL